MRFVQGLILRIGVIFIVGIEYQCLRGFSSYLYPIKFDHGEQMQQLRDELRVREVQDALQSINHNIERRYSISKLFFMMKESIVQYGWRGVKWGGPQGK